MLYYRKLIMDAVSDPDVPNNASSQNPRKSSSYGQLAREMRVPLTSVHDWGNVDYKYPNYKSLEKLANFFNVPIPALLMKVGDERTHDNEILEALFGMTDDQKLQVVEFIRAMKSVWR